MASISEKLPGAVAADNLGYVDSPARAYCQAMHFFGGTQAASIANRVNPNAPLIVNRSPTYEANAVLMTGNTGPIFTTPFNGQAYNRTSILVFADDYESIATPSVPTLALGPSSTEYLSWNSIAQFARWIGADFDWRQSSARDVVGPVHYTMALSQQVYFPDGTVRTSNFKALVLTEDSATLRGFLQNGTALELLTPSPVAVGGSPPVVPDSPTLIGVGGNSAQTQWRAAFFAQYTALADSLMMKEWFWVMGQMANRGVNICAPDPLTSV